MTLTAFPDSYYDDQTFDAVKLEQHHISNKEFNNCTFQDCDFTGCTFNNCEMNECTFNNCNLSLVQFTNSCLNKVAFTQSKLVGINWTQTRQPTLVTGAQYEFKTCIMNDSSFQGLKLQKMILTDCRAHDVDFREADLSDANCSGSDFRDSLFMHSNLNTCDFSNATNYNIDIRHNEVTGAKFDRYESVRLLQCLDIEIVD